MAREGSLYIQIDVGIDRDRDVVKLNRWPKEARATRELFIGMIRYCKDEQSDGHVPAEIVGQLAYPDTPAVAKRQAQHLVDVGLVTRGDDGDLFVPSYSKWNRSRAEVMDIQAKRAAAGKRGGRPRKDPDGESNVKAIR